jgi:hypothetical protein
LEIDSSARVDLRCTSSWSPRDGAQGSVRGHVGGQSGHLIVSVFGTMWWVAWPSLSLVLIYHGDSGGDFPMQPTPDRVRSG